MSFKQFRKTRAYIESQRPVNHYIKPVATRKNLYKPAIEVNLFRYLYAIFKNLHIYYDEIIYREKSGNIYFIGKSYKLFLPFYYIPFYSQYNDIRKIEKLVRFKLYLDDIDIREAIERIFYDLNKCLGNIEVVFRFCQYIVNHIKKFYDLPCEKKVHRVKNTKSSKKVFIHNPNKVKNHIKQLVEILFDGGNIDFLSLLVQEKREQYRFGKSKLLKCNGNYFHKLNWNVYFEEGYLEKLESDLRSMVIFDRELVGDFINLRFEGNRLVVKFNGEINSRIWSKGFIDEILDKFVDFGKNELYTILSYYGINRKMFENNTTAENYTRFHLAKNIGCNVEKEQPEILERLIDRVGKEKESLSYLGLDNYKHCIDYSHGYAEYEIHFNNINGVSLDDIKRDLEILEPRIKAPQVSIDSFLDKNYEFYDPKSYMGIKGFLPIPEFTIEPNEYNKNGFPLEYNTPNENHYFNILEKLMYPYIKVRNPLKS